MRRVFSGILAGTVLTAAAAVSQATPTSYLGTDVTFHVPSSSSSAGGIYGTPSTTGDSLQTTSPGLAITSGNGHDESLTAIFSATVTGNQSDTSITNIAVGNQGTYLLLGSLTGFASDTVTSASINATLQVSVLGVDGHSLGSSPVTSSPVSLSFSPDGGTYHLNGFMTQSSDWSGGGSINIDNLLASNHIAGSATKVSFTLTTNLLANSLADTSATIMQQNLGPNQQTHFDVTSGHFTPVIDAPTPAAAGGGLVLLLGLGLVGLIRRRRAIG